MQSDTPAYSIDGLIGVAILNAEWASAIFYCEDENYEAIYQRFIQKLCPELKNILVVCTGGKTVTQKLAERRNDIVIPHIMLLDKDYDDLNGHIEKRLNLGITYFRRYSIENYITQIEALIEISLETLCGTDKNVTKTKLRSKIYDYEEFISLLTKSLEDIGRYFVVCQANRIGIMTCKTPGHQIFPNASDQNPTPRMWFEEFKNELNEYILANSDWMLQGNWLDNQLSSAFTQKFSPWGLLSPSDHIVGKHLLFGVLTYIDARLGTHFREMGTKELYLRLLNHVELEELDYLREEILSTIGYVSTPSATLNPATSH